jgi:diguanylate cyclase (GGDEF)-like protein
VTTCRDIRAVSTAQAPTARSLIADGLLLSHFQPIVSLSEGSIYGHEALVRTPPDCLWRSPHALFEAARAEGAELELEFECVRRAVLAWARSERSGKLFINLSAHALLEALAQSSLAQTLELFAMRGIAPSSVVVELTEHERVHDVEQLVRAVKPLRRQGVAIALDDFGDGRSSLRLWSELRPDLVKLDKYFTHGLPDCGDKLQTFRALLQISETFGSRLVAEGIETLDELHVLRDLGVEFGQGYALGLPASQPEAALPPEVTQVLCARDVAVFPQPRRSALGGITAGQLLVQAPVLTASSTHDAAMALFAAQPGLPALALVDDAAVPVMLVNRQRLTADYMRPFFREIYGRRPVALHGRPAPLLVDLHAGIDELAAILTSDDQRYLSDGFVITEGGHYRGLGTGEQLVRAVTEARIEAARHANPLTFLPGNIPISDHIARLLDSRRRFIACYADLNHFKPFNDIYGYWRGDQAIRLAARVITAHADTRRDFVGHVGGDDFIIVFQSEDWAQRSARISAEFNHRVRELYDADAQQRGGIEAEDRYGVMRFHPCTTLSIGAVEVTPGLLRCPEDVANAAATAKRRAKHHGRGLWLLDASSDALRQPLAAGLP